MECRGPQSVSWSGFTPQSVPEAAQLIIQNSQLAPVQVCRKTLKSSGTGGPPWCQRLDILLLALARMTGSTDSLALAGLTRSHWFDWLARTCSNSLTLVRLTHSHLLDWLARTCSNSLTLAQTRSHWFDWLTRTCWTDSLSIERCL